MRLSHGRIVCVLMLGAALLLPGCKKKPVAAQKEAAPSQTEVARPPQGNPILPQPGQQLQGGGAIQNVRGAVRRTVDLNQLKTFSLAYFQYQTLNGKGPSRVEDIKDSLDANTLSAFKDGTCVGVWNLSNLSSSTIVAYVKDPDMYGTHVVAMGDGSAIRMNQQDFDKAMKGK